jgi:hypothetical protein
VGLGANSPASGLIGATRVRRGPALVGPRLMFKQQWPADPSFMEAT